MEPIKVVVHGVLGKMGQEVLRAVAANEGMRPVGAADVATTEGDLALPDGSGTVPISNNLSHVLPGADVVVDFTNSEGASNVLRIASAAKVNVVIGSTGLTQHQMSEAKRLAQQHSIGIVIAPNFAMGAVLMIHLVKQASRFFEYADLTEVHHEEKIDAPSGTAMAIVEAAANGRGKHFTAPAVEKQVVPGTRGGENQGVVIHSGRMPGRVAHHEMVFGALGQTLTIRHDSINRESFMPGVLMAIRGSIQKPGLIVGLDKIMGL